MTKYIMTTLSPIHIGNGDVLSPLYYYLEPDKKFLHVFYPETLMRYVKPSSLGNFMNYFNLHVNQYHQQKKRSDLLFSISDLVQKGVLDKVIFSETPDLKLANFSKETTKKALIQKTLKSLESPCIPGSTIKGVIRSAILFDILLTKSQAELAHLVAEVKQLRSNEMMKLDKILIAREIKNDIFRAMTVSDCLFNKEETAIFDYSILGNNEFSNSAVEMLKENQVSEFTLHLNHALLQKNKQANLNANGKASKFKQELADYFTEENINHVLHQFAAAYIEEQISYFRSHSLHSSVKAFETLKKKNTPQAPLIFVGMHTGYLAHTVSLAIKQKDKELYVREFKEVFATPLMQKNFKDKTKERQQILNTPTSRKILHYPSMPVFGCCQLTVRKS